MFLHFTHKYTATYKKPIDQNMYVNIFLYSGVNKFCSE